MIFIMFENEKFFNCLVNIKSMFNKAYLFFNLLIFIYIILRINIYVRKLREKKFFVNVCKSEV